jgi:hypothetical protein
MFLLLRIAQNAFKNYCPELVDFVAELSYELFNSLFTKSKCVFDAVAFFLNPHGRDGFKNGYFQWGCCPSNKYFKHYDFLYAEDNNDYYSFGDYEKTKSHNVWIENSVLLKPEEEDYVRPYLWSILSFYSKPEKDISSKKIKLHSFSSTVKETKLISNAPFDTIISTSENINNSKKFLDHKKELLEILNSSLYAFCSLEKPEYISKKKLKSKRKRITINKKSKKNKHEIDDVNCSSESEHELFKEERKYGKICRRKFFRGRIK